MQINFTLNQIHTEKKLHLALITTETNKSVMINHRLCKLDVGVSRLPDVAVVVVVVVEKSHFKHARGAK